MDATVSPADAGRSCPYCRFPLKQDMAASSCDRCGALHHQDCWRDGGGCAVVGCGQAAPEVPPPPPFAALPAPPRRGMAAGVLVGLAVAVAAVGGYLVAHRDGGSPSASVAPAARTPASDVSGDGNGEEVPPPEVVQQTAMQRLARLVVLSQGGRAAVREGRYLDAIANRETIIARLDAIDGARGQVAVARNVLRDAMEASLESDRAYAAQADPRASDLRATDRKRAFVAIWNPLAQRYGLSRYTESDI